MLAVCPRTEVDEKCQALWKGECENAGKQRIEEEKENADPSMGPSESLGDCGASPYGEVRVLCVPYIPLKWAILKPLAKLWPGVEKTHDSDVCIT